MASGDMVPGQLRGRAESEPFNQRICQPCLERNNLVDAIGLCVDCQDYLCTKCFDDHKVQQRRVLCIEQMLQRQSQAHPKDICSNSCLVHENEVIQYYCTTHCHLGCKSCIRFNHAACDGVHFIPDVSKELVDNEDYTQVEIQLKSVLSIFMKVFRNGQRNSEKIDKSCTDAIKEMQDFQRRMDDAFIDMRRELVNTFGKVHTLRLKAELELANMINKYKAAHEELQSSLAKIEYLKHTHQNCSAYIEMMRTKEYIKSLEDQAQQAEVDISYRHSSINFTPNNALIEMLRNPEGFGSVSSAGTRNVLSGSDEVPFVSDTASSFSDDFSVLSHETVPSFTDDVSVITDTGSRISHPSLHTGNVQSVLLAVSNVPGSESGDISCESAFGTRDYHLQNLHVSTESDLLDCSITGMIVLPDSRLVLADYKNISIKVVDVQTGQVVTQLKLNDLPCDITLIEKNNVAVTMPLRQRLAFVTVGDDNLSIYRTLTVDGECQGADYRNGKLAVSFIDPHKVQILNSQGRVLNSIPRDTSGKNIFNFPYYVTFGQDETTLYVSNYMDNSVVCVNMDGTVVATYRDTDLRYPKKAVVDSSGNVYVCAFGSSTVHQITKDCKKLRLLTQADGLDLPCSLCLSENNDKLYVGMYSDYVRVYRANRNESQQ